MSATWVDAVYSAHAQRIASRAVTPYSAPTTREWLAAVLLDDAGLEPLDVLRGTTVLSCQDGTLEEAAICLLHYVYAGALSRGPAGTRGHLHVVTESSEADVYDSAVAEGSPVVAVCVSPKLLKPAVLVALADRDYAMADVGRPAIVDRLVEVVAGTPTNVSPEEAAALSSPDLLRAVQLGSSPYECLSRIRAVVAQAIATDVASAKVAAGGKGATKPEAAPAAPVPLAAAAGEVVRKLSDMTGFGEAGRWGFNLAADIRDYRAGRLAWRDVDRGVLLSGPPGSGKTTFAKSLALECQCELYPTTYNDWSAAGSGSNDTMSKGMTKLFEQWRKAALERKGIILFIDEVDTIGRRGGNGHNESWFTSIINAWLAFLDGAVPRDGVVVVAATNYPDRVDPALCRPGRLDRHVELPMPDAAALGAIVRRHLGDDAIIDAAELAQAARAVRGRSPAEIALLCRDARRLARWCRRRVCAGDLTDVLAAHRLQAGVNAETERATATHEAAHAVAAVVLGVDRLTSVDLDRSVTNMAMEQHWTQAVVEGRLTMLLAARAAEELILGASSTGAQQDLRDGTVLATGLHAAWGWGAAGLVALPTDAALDDPDVRRAVRGTLDEAYGRACALVGEHRGEIEAVADALLRLRHLDASEVRAVMSGREVCVAPKPAPRPAAPRARTVGNRIPPGI